MMIYQLLKPLLFRLDAEQAHELISGFMRGAGRMPGIPGLVRALLSYNDPILAIECAGLPFANPIGLAAGFDKRATLIDMMGALGFGHVEIGTVTPRPQPGNPRPRLFRLPEDQALINRLGFNSPGMVAAANNLRSYRHSGGNRVIIGANIGKNKTTELEQAAEDYIAAFIALAPLADYITINISSPNTPGLRLLHERAALETLLGAINTINQRLDKPRPVFLKISPDESFEQLEEVVRAGCEAGIAGFIATNTTLDRPGLHNRHASETGGLSGRPLATRARAVAARIYRLTGGSPAVISVGGIDNAGEAYRRIRAGARLVQLYTGLIYQGPDLPARMARELAELLRRDGFRCMEEAIGADL